MSFSIQYVPIEAAAGAASLKQAFLFDGSAVQLTTGNRTMSITQMPDGDLSVDCRDMLGRQVNPTTLTDPHTVAAQRARTHAVNPHRWDKGDARAGGPPVPVAVPAGMSMNAAIEEVLSIERTLDLGDSDDRKALAASIWEAVQRVLGTVTITPPPAEEDRTGMGKPNAATQAVIDGRLAADDGAQQRYENVDALTVPAGNTLTIPDPPQLVIGDDLVEIGARAAFERGGAMKYRGCLWEDPQNKYQTTELTRQEFRDNFRAALTAVIDYSPEIATLINAQDPIPEELTAQERMLSVGIRGVLGRTGGINLGDPVKRRKLAADLFDYCRKYQPATPGETVWPEWQVRESIRRAVNVVFPGAEAPIRRDTVDGILENLKHYVEKSPKQDETPVVNIKPTTKPERKLKETIASVVNVHMDMVNPRTRAKLVNGLFHELNQAPLTQPTYDTFGGFWDAMTALRRDDARAVLFMADGIVYAATLGTMPDGETPTWMVNRGAGNHRPLHEYHNAPGYIILAMAADTVDVPF